MSAKVAVVGGGLGGLAAAGALAKAGVAVTLFETTGALGGKAATFREGGLTLDWGPTLLALPHLAREAFEALGAADLFPRTFELEEQCRYHFADGARLSAYRDVERTAASAAGIDPGERQGVLDFYADARELWRTAGEPYLEAPLESLAAFMARVARRGPGAVVRGALMGTLAELAERRFRTPHLRQFAGRFATYAGASPYRASAAFAQIAHAERAFGALHVEGGIGALASALERAVRRLGVEVRLGAPARWERRGARAVVGPKGGEAEFDAVVVNADPLAHLGRADEPLALSGYVLLLEAPRAALPHHTIAFSADYPAEFAQIFAGRAPEDPTVHVCHPAATDASMAPPGRSGLYLMANAPPLGRDGAWPFAAELRERCLDRLFALAPELRGRVRVLAERTPADLARLGAPGGSIYGFLPHGALGPFRRPRNRGDWPGLFFAGGGTHPGGGVPLVLRSGLFAARLALSHLGARA